MQNPNGTVKKLRYERPIESRRGRIKTDTFRKDNAQYMVANGDVVLFVNRGQNFLLIDEQILVKPGGYFKERNVNHDYSWYFVTNPSPPAVSRPVVFPGNHVSIRVVSGFGMSDSEISNPAEITTGAISVTTTPPVDVTPSLIPIDTTADFVVPANAKSVRLENIGGLSPAASTVNGDIVRPGYKLYEKQDWDGVDRLKLPAISVVTNGSRWVGSYRV